MNLSAFLLLTFQLFDGNTIDVRPASIQHIGPHLKSYNCWCVFFVVCVEENQFRWSYDTQPHTFVTSKQIQTKKKRFRRKSMIYAICCVHTHIVCFHSPFLPLPLTYYTAVQRKNTLRFYCLFCIYIACVCVCLVQFTSRQLPSDKMIWLIFLWKFLNHIVFV